jgi:hypothetical protein
VSDLKNYVVINRMFVESFARQLGLPIDQEQTTEGNFGVGIKVGSAGFTRSRKQSPLSYDDPRLLPPIVDSLRESGQLRVFRPDRTGDFESADPSEWYVYEHNVYATPVLIPVKEALGGADYVPDYIKVWVLDPTKPSREPIDKWDWLGAYVFIVQELLDLKIPDAGWSGVSALRLLIEGIAVKERVTVRELARSDDVFGRWHEGHPLEKLKKIGGTIGRSRRIETIYKIAYMSDEQSINVDGVNKRINDILAYPLYIAE